MPIRWDERNRRYRWEFDKVIEGQRFRSSRLLPKDWSEATARRFDAKESARVYNELTLGKPPLIERAVALYVSEHLPHTKDRLNAGRHLAKLVPVIAGRRLNELGAVSRKYIADSKKLAPATVKQRLALLQAAANYALKYHGLGRVEWIAQMTLPAVRNARQLFPDRRDVLLLARKCRDRATRALVLVTFATGSRPGECHRSTVDGDCLVVVQKNGEVERKPVPPRVRRYLRHWPMKHGYTYHSKRIREARVAAGMPALHAHDLRHGAASALLAAGASLRQVGLVLGHKSAQATARYTHLADEEKRRLLVGLWQKSPHS